ncbi:LysM peptidoglycan-binding domain-containing protein [Actinosynnema sp. NPDC023587]|uniref:LysM peptidoglycan-binding domain-containing protein n=1 Tax=Actinosynnema sp. NPDC023587 TaxID=3154695 RepID=UPI0033F41E33
MAVVVGTRNGFDLVDGTTADDVRRGHQPHPGPRVLRTFGDTRRPTTPRPRPAAARTAPDPAACQVRRSTRHPALRFALHAAVAIVAAVTLSLLYLYGSGATTVPERTSVVHVQVGESLWEVAERSAPDSDPEAVVDRIRSLNNLTDTTPITPGLPLVVPDGRTAPTT